MGPETELDVLIVGGGLVGASLACALGETRLRVGLVEAVALRSESQPSYDERVIALSWGSRLILAGMGVWPAVAREAEPIREIHISDRGHFGFARLDCEAQGTEALGYVVPARVLGRALYERLAVQGRIELSCPARLAELQVVPDAVEARIDFAGETRALRARLLVAADGGQSSIREREGLAAWQWEYGQTAVIATLTPERPRAGLAFERFTDSGPLAMLPMTEGRYSVVWTARDAEAPELLALGEGAFLARLQERFGYRLGRLGRLGQRAQYPLRLLQAKHPVGDRLALIGNAAHSLHPVAGQGFNLGLRDVAELAEILAEVSVSGGDPGSAEALQRFADARRWDQRTSALITDGLARLFASPLFPLAALRNTGLLALDLLPGLKPGVARQFMGMRGRLPRLSRGLPLVRQR